MKIYFLLCMLFSSEATIAMQQAAKPPLIAHAAHQTYGTANQQQVAINMPALIPVANITQTKRRNYTKIICENLDTCINSQACTKGTAWTAAIILAMVLLVAGVIVFNSLQRTNAVPKQ